jgi:hypothetical protein
MLGEKQGGQFSTTLCPTQTEGVLKSIVFTRKDGNGNINVGDALQAGVQIHIFGEAAQERSDSDLQRESKLRSESNPQAVTINANDNSRNECTSQAMRGIYWALDYRQ